VLKIQPIKSIYNVLTILQRHAEDSNITLDEPIQKEDIEKIDIRK